MKGWVGFVPAHIFVTKVCPSEFTSANKRQRSGQPSPRYAATLLNPSIPVTCLPESDQSLSLSLFLAILFPLRWSNYPTLPDSRISLVALQPTHLSFGVAGLRFLRPLCAAFSYQATASHAESTAA